MRLKKFLPVIMIATILITAGCDKQDGDGMKPPNDSMTEQTNQTNQNNPNEKDSQLPPKPPQKNSNDKNESKAKDMKIRVYYPDESGLRLVGVNREIKINDTKDKYKAAVDAVMTPPNEKNLTSVIKNNSSLISVDVKEGTATVNFDKKIKNGFVGGSTGEEFLIGSVVNTLTEFKEVKNVKFLIDGKEVETLSGHMDLTKPIERMNNLMNN